MEDVRWIVLQGRRIRSVCLPIRKYYGTQTSPISIILCPSLLQSAPLLRLRADRREYIRTIPVRVDVKLLVQVLLYYHLGMEPTVHSNSDSGRTMDSCVPSAGAGRGNCSTDLYSGNGTSIPQFIHYQPIYVFSGERRVARLEERLEHTRRLSM